MFKRIIAYPTGKLIFYYNDRTVIDEQGKTPIIKTNLYSHKDKYGNINSAAVLPNSSSGIIAH